MKNIRNIMMMAVATLFAMTACDIVEEPFLQGGDPITPGTTTKKVLLEDFTGVRCVNCPAAAVVASQLQEVYPEQLIVMGVHAGGLTTPYTPTSNFRTSEGTEWFTYFGFDVNPIGTVNRASASGTFGINSGQWGGAVAEELAKTATVEMAISNSYDEAARSLSVEVTTKLLDDQTEDLSLVVCMMEDSIVAHQQTPEGVNPDYVHRHVFRGTLNGAWGDPIVSAPANVGASYTKNYTFVLPENYEAKHCHVVAYVYQNSDKYIVQAEECSVIE